MQFVTLADLVNWRQIQQRHRLGIISVVKRKAHAERLTGRAGLVLFYVFVILQCFVLGS
jgi:hypothetical protein